MKKRILSFLLALCMCLTLVPVTVLADDDVQQINDAAVQAITPGSDVSVLSVVPDTGAYRTYKFYSGETLLSEQIVKNGDTLYEPSVTAPAGKTFTGWNPNVTFGTVSNVDKTETIEVEAQFADGYHVYFKDNNGRIIATKTGETGKSISVADVNFPVGNDEAITGWYTDAAHTKKVESVTIETSDITLYAKVEKGYWLTFESNGGSYVAPAFYANGTPAAAPDKPTKSGYTFAGWYTDENLMTAANFDNITATTTLYAKWTAGTETKYTVIHFWENANDDGYSFKESETKTGATGGTTNADAKRYQGFTAQTITQKDIKGDDSTIVSVYYKRNEYSVKFYTNSSLFSDSTEYTALRITAKYGANISAKWPTYNGSNAWATSDGGNTYQVNIDTMPLGGAKFYGPKTGRGSETAYYYVEVLPGETGTVYNGVTYKEHHHDTSPGRGSTVSQEDKYDITGFTYKEGTWNGKRYNNSKFYYTRNEYKIVFVNNGSTDKTVAKKFEQSIADASYTPTAPAGMTDYFFDGWYDNELGEGTAYVFDGKTMPANNITLYAKWVAPTYTVTVYDVDGSSVLETFTEVPMNNTIDEANMPVDKVTKDTDDEFLGWVLKSDENSLDGMPFNFSTKITKDYELRAKVGSKAQYSVTYNANATGATGSVTDTEKYAKGAEATVMSNSFRNGDMVFLGWNTKADGTGTTYYPNGTIKVTDNMDLYAQWGDKASTVQLTYKANGGKEADITETDIPNNKQVTLRDENTFTRTGYHFTGWNTEANGTGTSFSAGASARVDNLGSGNVLYAQWTPNTNTAYKVEFYYQNDDGSYPSTASKTEPRTGTTDTTVSVTDTDKADKENGKYTFDANNANNILSGPVAADGSLVLKLYFKLNQFQLTINYVYADGTTAATSHSETLTVGEDYSVNSPEIEGYTPSKDTVSGTMPAENVEVTVIYSKRSDLSYTVHYYWNGTTESVAPDKTVPGQTFGDIITTETAIAIEGYTALPNQTCNLTVGVDASKNVINFYYYKNVELTANSDEVTYDGEEHSVSGFTGAPEGVTFNGISASGSGTDVGAYNVIFDGTPVGTVDTTNKYIVTETTPGQLTIKPVEVTVTIKGNTKTETYDGTEYTVTGYTIESISNNLYKEEYFALKTDAKAEAKGTNAGDYTMGLTAGSFANSNTNFEVTFVVEDGKLTIKPVEVTVTIKGNTKTETYDGTEYTVTGYTIESISNDLYSADNVTLKDGAKAEAKGTNAGDYMMRLTKESFENKNTNFKVTFVVEDGKLTIAKRDVTVTGESATKVYNGQTQEINGYTVDNLVKGHEMTGVIYSAKGKDPGKYDGSFTGSQIVIKDAASTDVTANYNVKPVIGVLTITQPSHPTRPSTPTKDVTSVKTADGSQMTLWMSMMLASAAGIVFLGKKRKEEQ